MNTTVHFGYDPRCQLYSRELKEGTRYYLSYYLPNGVRQRRPCDSNFGEAKKRLRLKKAQLLKGHFDEKDLRKLRSEKKPMSVSNRISLDEGLALYLENTKSRKKPGTHYQDQRALTRYVSYLRNLGCTYIDEIRFLHIQKLFNDLDKRGLAFATLQSAVAMIKKYFNWFIDEAELVQMKNPVPRKFKLPNRGSKSRDRLASDEEIRNLLSVDISSLRNMGNVPVLQIVGFIIFTGARLGEVLHAEFKDFDLEKGLWHIRYKPNCPTKDELGWGPKWNKSRVVSLLPEAIQILLSMPQEKSEGLVLIRDDNGQIVERKRYPANFVFPKRVVEITDSDQRKVQHMRLDSIKNSWSTLKQAAGVTDLQLKDLRTYFNYTLKSTFGFTAKEAGAYIGNSAEINDLHYTPATLANMESKLRNLELSKAIGL
jgi:integrase